MRRRVAVALATSLSFIGLASCGFVGGVDFFDLQRARDAGGGSDTSTSEDALAPAGDAGDAGDQDAAAARERIYVLGGSGVSSTLPPVGHTYVADVNADGSIAAWTRGPDLPASRGMAPAAAGSDFIAMVGGISTAGGERGNLVVGRTGDGGVQSFVDSANAFAPGRAYEGAVRHGDSVFVVGGIAASGAFLDDVVYGTVTASGVGTFAASAKLPAGLARAAVAATDDALYVAGGEDGGAKSASILVARFQDAGTSSFTVAQTLPTARKYAQAVAYGSALIVVGGETDTTIVPDVLVYPILAGGSLGAVSKAPPVPAMSTHHQVVVAGGHLFVIGGYVGAAATANVYVADVTLGGTVSAWRPALALPEPLIFHSALAK